MDTREQLRCQELVELVTEYLEGALPPEEQRAVEEHLATCDGCTTYVEQMRTTLRITGTLRAETLTPEAETALRELFRGWRAAS